MVQSDDHSQIVSAVDRTQGLGRAVKQQLRRQFPMAVGLGEISVTGCERLGERVSGSRAGRIGLLGIVALLFVVDPAAAQVDCGSGLLKFFGDLETLTVESVGILLLIMLISAGALKALPIRGTDKWGNSAIGGFIVATTFFVLAPVVIDIADSATPVDLSSECNAGGGGS